MTSVAVIGTGPSGLAAAKSLAEQGLEPDVFEARSDIGGMWGGPARGAWSSSARTNLSFHSCAFSDFPWPPGTEVFPYRSELAGYLKGYAEEFGLREFIRFDSRVESLRPEAGHRWRIAYRQGGSARNTAVYDHVVVASGFFSKPYTPLFAGLEDFRGRIFHSADCDSPQIFGERFHGKRVLVVGAAFSGTEIASLLVQFAASVTVALRTPMWFVPRWIPAYPDGRRHPLDLVFYNRCRDHPWKQDPARFLAAVAGDPGAVSPELAFDRDRDIPLAIVIADAFLDQVRARLIGVKRSARLTFDATGVTFSDGRRQDFDVVVMCTGFQSDLRFFGAAERRTLGFQSRDQLQPTLLHRHVFHPDLPGLAFVGHYRGPYFPVMELQSRWISRIVTGELPLPSRQEMMEGIEEERRIRHQIPRPQFPHGDFVGLADGLAGEVGVFPRLDAGHPLRAHIERGPVVPAHFRLVGPDAKPDLAAKLILAAPAPLLER